MSFDNFGLSEGVLRAITEEGYATPTAVQAQSIPIILMGRDLLGFAPTGTGKTASFILPMIDILDGGRLRSRMPRSLILSPTRELATQIAANFDTYGKYSNLTKALLIGGVGFEEQERLLDRGVDVLIATPGRLLDHFGNGRIMLNDVKILVIDEADRMMDMGFIPDIEKIVGLLPVMRQTLMFSATMPKEILQLAKKFLMNPKEVKVERPVDAEAKIDQRYIKVPSDFKAKRAILREVLREIEIKNAYVFCNRKKDVDVLAKSLTSHGFSAAGMHGDMDQHERNKTFEAFKAGTISFLICSDVAARGLDVTDVSHVINFDVPMSPEDYIHRIGRTGRAGKTGMSITLVSGYDEKFFEPIKKQANTPIELLPLKEQPLVEGDEGYNPVEFNPRERHHKFPRNRGGKRRGGRDGNRHGQSQGRPVQDKKEQNGQRQHAPRQQMQPVRQHDDAPRPPQPPKPERTPERGRGGEPVRHDPQRDQSRSEKTPPGLGGHVPAFLLKK